MKKFDPNDKGTPRWVTVIAITFLIVVTVAMFILIIGVILRQPVSLPSYMLPHLVMAGFFQQGDSHYKMSSIQHRELLKRRDRATVKLFKGIIIVAVILGLLFCFLSSTGG